MNAAVSAGAVLGHPGADCVLVQSGRITAIGETSALAASSGLAASDHGKTGVILTGLRDAHIHPSAYAAAVTGLSMKGVRDFGELGERVVGATRALAPGVPLVGSRLDENDLLEGRLPTRWDLDRLVDDRPLVLSRYCGHVAVANSAALHRAGITAGTPDPPEGSIDRDGQGRATGVLRETAISLVSSALEVDAPTPTPDQILAALSGLAGLGVTRLDAIVSVGQAIWCGTGSELDDLLEIAPHLPFEVSVFVAATTRTELAASAEKIRDAPGNLSWAGWKSFADGSFGGHTAAMDSPYADDPSTGTLRLDAVRDKALAEATLNMGGTVAIHAIGDRANTAVLDLFESLNGGNVDHTRLRVEHASVLSPGLVARFAQLGITASVQPAFISSEADWLTGRLGPERTGWTYPLRSLYEAGVPLLAGSDSPVEDPNPWPAMAAAAENPITPGQSLGNQRALSIFGGRAPAVGDPADLVVADRDPLTTKDLAGTTVLAAYVGGDRVSSQPLTWPG